MLGQGPADATAGRLRGHHETGIAHVAAGRRLVGVQFGGAEHPAAVVRHEHLPAGLVIHQAWAASSVVSRGQQ